MKPKGGKQFKSQPRGLILSETSADTSKSSGSPPLCVVHVTGSHDNILIICFVLSAGYRIQDLPYAREALHH
jgi:hypothetical protein